jgi:hypothetical protein
MLGRWLRQRGRWARLAMLLSAIACSPRTDAITSPNGLTLTAQSRLVAEPGGDTIRTTMRVVNTGTTPVLLNWGTCPMDAPLLLLAYRNGDAASPVWSYDRFGRDYVCPAVLELKQLQPGDSAAFDLNVAARDILGDSLPSGSYRFAVSGAHLNPPVDGAVTTGTFALSK